MINRFPVLKLSDKIPGAKEFNKWSQQLAESLQSALAPSATGGSVTSGPHGIHVRIPSFPVGIGLTTGTITARSGATLGSGTADFKLLGLISGNPSIVADAARTNLKVYSFSSSGTVASGKYFIWIRIYGYPFIITAEC